MLFRHEFWYFTVCLEMTQIFYNVKKKKKKKKKTSKKVCQSKLDAQAHLSLCSFFIRWVYVFSLVALNKLFFFSLISGTPSPCDINNGGCSHICTVTDNNVSHCGCNDTSLMLGNRGKMCIPVNHSCPADEFVCRNSICLK